MNKLNYKLILIIAIATFLSHPVWAQENPRLVTVTGEGEVMTVPDEVYINFQMESFDENLSKAKSANDTAIKQALEIIRKYKVDEKDYRTDFFTVRFGDNYFTDPQTNQQRSKRGYFVTKNIGIIVRDITRFEVLYSEALEAGINNIYGIEFKTSKIKEYQEEARTLAVRNAKEKAAKLAGELGQQIGVPHSIQENIQSDWNSPRAMMAKAMAGGAEANETIALGQIKITVSVVVSFELK